MKNHLTVLSFGGGQDSTYILYRIAMSKSYRRRWVQGDFVVVMSDTGNEHPHTYHHIEFIKKYCAEHGIEFYILTPDKGYHPRTWQSLESNFERNDYVVSIVGPRSCTDNLKIKPIYNFLDHYIARRYYGYEAGPVKGKKFISRFAEEYGKIRVLIGIAAGEEQRIKTASKRELKSMQTDAFRKWKNPVPVWFRNGIEKIYPLVEEGIARWDIHDWVLRENLPLPFPSNCMYCPYLSKIEAVWLYRNHRDRWDRWVQFEANKLAKYEGKVERNMGVKGGKTLSEFLTEAMIEFAHMTDEQLDEHKMSHGHCVMSKY